MDPGRCTAAQRGRYVPLSIRSGKLISADAKPARLGNLMCLDPSQPCSPRHPLAKIRPCMRDRLHNVRFWHLAEIQVPPGNVSFWHKADIDLSRGNVRFWG